MYNSKSVIGIIPARGGSKGVPRKNIRELGGKPLIAWTIMQAKQSKYLDRLLLSSEDSEIIEVAKSYGCEVPFIRPKELAEDATPGIEPVLHALKILKGYDYVVLLQPTSPLRNSEDIDNCIKECISREVYSCVSVAEVDKSPFWMYAINAENKLEPLVDNGVNYTRRQDLPKNYVLNGAVYVANCDWLLKSKSFLTKETNAYIMPKERSLDIDTEIDFKIVEFLMQSGVIFKKISKGNQ